MFEGWAIEWIISLFMSWIGPVSFLLIIVLIGGGFIGMYRLHQWVANLIIWDGYQLPMVLITKPLLWIFEILCNYTILLVIFRQIPPFKRASRTLHEKAHQGHRIAQWICRKLLNPKGTFPIYPSEEYPV